MLRAFSAGDAFVGFHEDTIPSVVIQVYNELEGEEQEGISQDGTEDPWESEVKTKLSLTIKIESQWFSRRDSRETKFTVPLGTSH